MKYAIIEIKGQQFKVSEGQEILVNKMAEKEKPDARVLLVSDEGKLKIGKPEVKDAKITLKVLGQEKGKKISVFKYKSKSRYRKKMGSRPEYTRLSVSKIS